MDEIKSIAVTNDVFLQQRTMQSELPQYTFGHKYDILKCF